MSGVQAAIVELEAKIAHWRGIVAELRLFARDFDQPGDAPVACAAPVAAQPQAPRPIAQGATPPRAKDIVMTPSDRHGEIDRRVLNFLRAYGPVGARKIRAGLKLSESQFKGAVARLRAQHLVMLQGTRATARWAIVANTKALGAPVGGRANATEFETVWSGRKDDPSLLGDRVQRQT